MPMISQSDMTRLNGVLSGLRDDRLPWWEHWREVADYLLPRRYVWLQSPKERARIKTKSPYILDPTGTLAARTLAAGMMNGITSPARPWFKLRIPGTDEQQNRDIRIWLDEAERQLLFIMGESNFYTSMGTLYLDLAVFGTGAMLVYEDFESVFRCYNSALGEYYLGQSQRLDVNRFARDFTYKVGQVCERWGEENLSKQTLDQYRRGGASLFNDVEIIHLIEPNDDARYGVPASMEWRELYWEAGTTDGRLLAVNGFREKPGVFPRWELVGNDAYGSSPGMDALADVIQLQHETKAKAQSLDLMNKPPLLADVELQNQPNAFLPRGVTYVSRNSFGAKPAWQVNPPLGAMTEDILDIRERIREAFHNDLFKMIANLDTVRSATEIDARREEKLVLLGPVLERFEVEALNPVIHRIFSIANRAKLLPDPPEAIQGRDIEIQYVSVLSVAQRAVAAAPVERFAQFIGQLVGVAPEVRNVPDWTKMARRYGEDIGVSPAEMQEPGKVAADTQGQQQQQQLAQMAEVAKTAGQGAAALSGAAPGGAAQVAQQLVGG